MLVECMPWRTLLGPVTYHPLLHPMMGERVLPEQISILVSADPRQLLQHLLLTLRTG